MTDLQVKIVQLEPMRVAVSYGFGKNPEELAFAKIEIFASKHGLLHNDMLPTTFGFNNPDPSPGSPNYGYEVWLPIQAAVGPDEELAIKEFTGGMYAVTSLMGVEKIGEVWKQLVIWQEKSEFKRGNHQWLEKLLNPSEKDISKLMFELFLPISRVI